MDARLDLDIAVDEIEKAVSPDLLLLFGSAAAGRMRADSDIDLAYYGGKPLSAYEGSCWRRSWPAGWAGRSTWSI